MEKVILNKIESIERCVFRVEELSKANKLEDFLYQDAIILNIQRASQQAIDLAMYIISQKGFGMPKSSKEAFTILMQNKIITEQLAQKLYSMTGFRNLAIHEYQRIDLNILKHIAEHEIFDLLTYRTQIINYLKDLNK